MIRVDKKHNRPVFSATMDLLMKAIQSALIKIQINNVEELRDGLCEIVNSAYDAMDSIPKLNNKEVKYIHNWVNSNLEMFYREKINDFLAETVEDKSEKDDTMRIYVLTEPKKLLKMKDQLLNDKVNTRIKKTVWFWLKIGGSIISLVVIAWVTLRSTGVVNWPFPTQP